MGGGGGDGASMGICMPPSRKPARILWTRILGGGGPNGAIVASWPAWAVGQVVLEGGQPARFQRSSVLRYDKV